MDAEFGPDGALYTLEYGDGFFAELPEAQLSRIDFVRGGEYTPVVQVSATPTSATAPPLTVRFSSAGTEDPDGDNLAYAWDFDANGTVDSRVANPTYTYTQRGIFEATLRVTDTSGRSASNSVRIVIGNQAPVVNLTVASTTPPFNFGDTVHFTVAVTDDQPVDCARVSVAYILGHDQHGHPQTLDRGLLGRDLGPARHRARRSDATSPRSSWRPTPTSPAAARRRSRARTRWSCGRRPTRPEGAPLRRRPPALSRREGDSWMGRSSTAAASSAPPPARRPPRASGRSCPRPRATVAGEVTGCCRAIASASSCSPCAIRWRASGSRRSSHRLSDIGYREIEFAGYSAQGRRWTNDELRRLLRRYGLRGIGSHVNYYSADPTAYSFVTQLDQVLDGRRGDRPAVHRHGEPPGPALRRDGRRLPPRRGGLQPLRRRRTRARDALLPPPPLRGVRRRERHPALRRPARGDRPQAGVLRVRDLLVARRPVAVPGLQAVRVPVEHARALPALPRQGRDRLQRNAAGGHRSVSSAGT